jgi:tetratricopeptide (TPR) repeat protein
MKKVRKSAPLSKTQHGTPETLSSTAQGHVAAGRFREAIAAYKELLKIQETPEGRLGLASAYAGRARELVAKGMPKEALTVWENRAQLLPDLAPELDHLTLLLRLGRVGAVANLCVRGGARLDAASLAALRSHLAAQNLGGESGIATALPADDPILTQGPLASQALDAYCRGDDGAMADALSAIPFRSPYRDLAQILKALQRLPGDASGAAALLARVGDDTGFATLRRACELGLRARATPFEDLAPASEPIRRFALTLAGWGEERQALWEEVAKAGPPGPQALLRLLNRRRATLGEDWARSQALRLLVPSYPKSAAWITESGGRRLSSEEGLLVAAWRAEDSRTSWAEVDAWGAYAQHLIKAAPIGPGSDAALRIALALRRVDSHRHILDHASPSDDLDDMGHIVADALEQSLGYDPDDVDCYERLIQYYLRGKDLKSARRLLDPGLQRFPKGLGLLTAALEVALTGDSFKKAARYAREILALDPINTGARERLVKAHLAHGRKQIRAGRHDLARKELDQAEEWDQEGRLREQRDLFGAVLALIQDPHGSTAALREQVAALGGGIAAAFVLGLEAIGVGRRAAWLLKAASMGKIGVASPAELNALLGRLRARLDEGGEMPGELSRLIEKPLSAAAHWPLPRAECEATCETLRRAGLDRARRAFAEAALHRWPGAPVFVLHAFEASQAARQHFHPSQAELTRLDDARRAARETGDHRSAHRLGEIISRFSSFGRMGGRFNPFIEDDEDDDDAEELGPEDFRIDPNEALRTFIEVMGLDRLLEMIGISAKERAKIKAIERELGHAYVMDSLIGMLRGNLPDFGHGMPPDLGPGPKGGPAPSPGAGRSGGPKGKTGGGKGPPDDLAEQFELF